MSAVGISALQGGVEVNIGLHIPGVDAALDRAWGAIGATSYALRPLAGEPADEPPAPGM